MILKVVGLLILVLLFAVAVVIVSFVFGQHLEVVETARGSMIDVRSMGEYQANVRRIRISETTTNRIVWELQAANGHSFPLWTVELQEGSNLTAPSSLEGARVVVPQADTFDLSAGATYRVDLWSFKEKVPRHVSTNFKLRPGQGAYMRVNTTSGKTARTSLFS